VGPRVDHARFDALGPALDALKARVTSLAEDAAQRPAATQLKRYSPADQVVARAELAGPERRLASRHAGVDVRGDGSSEPYVGRVRRKRLEVSPEHDVFSALREALEGT
jgi:hypothetical protein